MTDPPPEPLQQRVQFLGQRRRWGTGAMQVLRTEGEDNGEWIIVDCGAAVAHIMQPAIRQYYHLEDLWGETPVRLKFGADKPVAKAAPKKVEEAKPTSLKRSSAAKKGSEQAFPSKAQLQKAAAKSAGKAPARKTAAAKTTAKKSAAKPAPKVVKVNAPKPAAKKAVAKKPAAQKAPAKKTTARKA